MPLSENTLRVLFIEDNDDHAALITRQLSLAGGGKMDVTRVGRLDAGLHALEAGHYDVLLLDLGLPDSSLPETVTRAVAAVPQIPIVVLTSLGDVEMGIKAVQDGAQDYLVKSQIVPDTLLRTLRYAIERKRVRLEADQYAAELERSNRDLERFARVVSHDLKSPLAVLQMDLRFLAEKLGSLPEDVADYFVSAEQQATNMGQLIDEMLAYSRIQQSDVEYNMVDCEEVFSTVMENLAVDIGRTGAVVSHDMLPSIKGNFTQLVQLLQNLIANAIKYSRAQPPEIEISAELLDHEWVFSVADNGIGVDTEDRERIFEMFERAHSAEFEGTGIGLATCKQIVARHGGRIWVQPNEPSGSVFFFSLPLAEKASRIHATVG